MGLSCMSYLLYYKTKKTTELVIERERSKKQSKEQLKASLIKNSGCCGAVSNAWVPSYQSLIVTQSCDSSSEDSESLDSSEVNACR